MLEGRTVTYTAEISRANPTAFVFLIDQSGSMQDAIGGEFPQRKNDVVADALNRLLSELSIKCAKEEGVRDYFHVSVIGYGANVGPALGGSLAGRDVVPLSEIASNPARLETKTKKIPDGAGGLVETDVKFPVWTFPVANGGTPMVAAIGKARDIVQEWLDIHPTCFPPVVINLTDGESTDGDPVPAADAVKALCSTDGDVLMFNLHVSSHGGTPTTFPDHVSALPDTYARKLFEMSSLLPAHMLGYAKQLGFATSDGTRGFVYNADVSSVVQFLDIGTRASDLR